MPKTIICQIPDCGKPHVARGWCSKHYQMWRLNGDPLVKRSPYGEAAQFYREIALAYEGDACLIWPFARLNNGYAVMTVNSECILVSRAVCTTTCGEPPSPKHEAAHSCGHGDLGCVNKRHLSWKTPKQNSADKIIHGTHLVGSDAPRAKLTDSEALEIFAQKWSGRRQSDIAAQFNISRGTISDIWVGNSWTSVTGMVNRRLIG